MHQPSVMDQLSFTTQGVAVQEREEEAVPVETAVVEQVARLVPEPQEPQIQEAVAVEVRSTAEAITRVLPGVLASSSSAHPPVSSVPCPPCSPSAGR